MIDLVFRCFSRDRWLAVAKARGVIDKDGHSVPGFEVDEIGNAELVPAVLDMKDPMNPTVITPAVIDTWFWINLRIHADKALLDEGVKYVDAEEVALEAKAALDAKTDEVFVIPETKFTQSKFAAFVRNQATKNKIEFRGKTIRVYEFGVGKNAIQLLDPRDYAEVALRQWLGGMSY